ncbi:MAG: helix-turn-helix transcriptional regulator [Saprospiraceae bacterium]|nr:helix-turn-helix transcriptional regulator [Saprospiraceae bacterium]
MNKLGTFIRLKREENHLLLRQLAAKLDMDVAYLSKLLEREQRIARIEHLPLFSEFLNVPKTTYSFFGLRPDSIFSYCF